MSDAAREPAWRMDVMAGVKSMSIIISGVIYMSCIYQVSWDVNDRIRIGIALSRIAGSMFSVLFT